MIAVLCRKNQKPYVEEFFQLFKVAWEFYEEQKNYEVVLVTDAICNPLPQKNIIFFSTKVTPFDAPYQNEISSRGEGAFLQWKHLQFPVYGNNLFFGARSNTLVSCPQTGDAAGFISEGEGKKVLRIGYDLFDQVEYLLTQGQPIENALHPTLEIHISLLRSWMLALGISFIEVPPIPYGHNFFACLTHDVDFLRITDHGLDHSLAGYLLRTFLPSSLRNAQNKIAWNRLTKNWKALLRLPGVYLGISPDTWFDLDRFKLLEKGIPSTFFFLPYANEPGRCSDHKAPRDRAGKYDVRENSGHLKALIRNGHEVGLHGIDAWCDVLNAQRERSVIESITGHRLAGIRMHWLYFNKDTPIVLERAGFHYDSSLGYNEIAGFRQGTTQVFILPGTTALYELPLHIMDTALFTRGRMNLPEKAAAGLCQDLATAAKAHGGVLTINWHTRSLSPERNWDDFYMHLLELLNKEGALFTGAGKVVDWFASRRSIRFESVDTTSSRAKIVLQSPQEIPLCLPPPFARIYKADTKKSPNGCLGSHTDIPLFNARTIEI